MRVLQGRNVNELFCDGMHMIDEFGVMENSRAGQVIVAPYPVTSVYERPCERVLFEPRRNANPFFHLMESLWMLAGRNDAAFLNHYVGDFGERFAESDGKIHGAYGHRWRRAFGIDQLNVVIEKLQKNRGDRQAVIQMWDCDVDLPIEGPVSGSNDLLGNWKDRPCNTHVYLRVRRIDPATQEAACDKEPYDVLDMTVCCRSNDIVWGAYGANAVHFSMLQEYLAGRIGVWVGTMYQVSNNFHVYETTWSSIGPPECLSVVDPYASGNVVSSPIGTRWSHWDKDLEMFMSWHDEMLWDTGVPLHKTYFAIANDWFKTVAAPVALANWQWKNAMKFTAMETANGIAAPDWRRACLEWMERRRK